MEGDNSHEWGAQLDSWDSVMSSHELITASILQSNLG